MIYVLTHEYGDGSGFHVCGVTQDYHVAYAWFNAADETNVYVFGNQDSTPTHWMEGKKGWRQEEQEKRNLK